jgi:hypothetical protein
MGFVEPGQINISCQVKHCLAQLGCLAQYTDADER